MSARNKLKPTELSWTRLKSLKAECLLSPCPVSVADLEGRGANVQTARQGTR